MKSTGIGFKQVYEYIKNDNTKELSKKTPLHEVVLDMVVRHLPSPIEAQKKRIATIWKGDLNSQIGQAMVKCDPKGPVALMITKIIADPHAGEVAVGRLFSGTLKPGMELYIVDRKARNRVQTVGLFMGPKRVEVPEIPAGNIVAVVGLRDAVAGSTCSIVEKIRRERGLEVITSPPIVVFRETVTSTSPVVEGKSPNKHNRFYIVVEPCPEEVIRLFKEGEVDMKMERRWS